MALWFDENFPSYKEAQRLMSSYIANMICEKKKNNFQRNINGSYYLITLENDGKIEGEINRSKVRETYLSNDPHR